MQAKSLLVLLAVAQLAGCFAAKEAPQPDPKLTNKLIELIGKKKFDDFVVELGKDGMDANQPDSKGKIPLLEAVKTKDIRFVDALIQFGALATAKDPATGTTPVQIAYQSGLKEIARILLQYGADINAADKSGKKARDFAPSADIKSLTEAYDKSGSLAFEDAPGTWIKSSNDKGEQYWYNIKTQEARWNIPPLCAWQRIEFQGQPSKYVNYVTHQSVVRMPPAMSWRRVVYKGDELWYNWVSNHTQVEQPDELPQYMVEEAIKLKNVRWYNPKTNQFSWEDPQFHSPWRIIKEDGSEKPYYYNVGTGESSWEVPDDLAWTTVEHEEQPGTHYWFNQITGEATWDAPEHHAWEKHDSDL